MQKQTLTFDQLPDYVFELGRKVDFLTTLLTSPTPATTLADEVLTLNQAADFLDLKPDTVYQLVSERKIPFSKPNGRRLYFSRAELTAWVQSGRKRTTTEIAANASQHVTRKPLKRQTAR